MIGRAAAALERIWYPPPGTGGAPPLLLRLAAGLFGAGVRRRALRFEREGAARRLPVPCVSVGNVVVGGTGKTPLVAWLVEALRDLGVRPAVVARGYGGSGGGPARVPPGGGRAEATRHGDEPALLAARYPAVPVVTAADRYAAGLFAVREHGAEVVVADDAFQHRRLARDLDIVVVDASRGMGNGLLLPAGPLREPPGALARADVVVLNRVGEAVDADARRREIARYAPAALLAESDLAFDGFRDAATGAAAELPPGSGVFAFCGLGNPASFRRSLDARGLRVLGWESFRDHHLFTVGEVSGLARRAAACGAAAAVTTAKDAVRIPAWPGPPPLYRAEVKLAMMSGRENIWKNIMNLVARGRG